MRNLKFIFTKCRYLCIYCKCKDNKIKLSLNNSCLYLYEFALQTRLREVYMICTKVFTSGNSQAVRIPKEFHIDCKELFIKKIGTSIVLFPKVKPWENLQKSFTEFTDDFMADGRNQSELQQREAF